VKGQRFGTLNFSSHEPLKRAFTEIDLELMRIMGNWISNMIERQQVEQELSAYQHDLEQLVFQRTKELKRTNDALLSEITARKKAEKRVRDDLSFLETLIDAIPTPVFRKDLQGIYRGCNSAFAEIIIGCTKKEIIGRSLFDLPEKIPFDLAKLYHEQDQKMMEGEQIQIYEAPVLCADGIKRNYLFNKVTFKDENSRIAGLVGVMIDISERKRYEAELSRLTSILEATSDLVATFTPDDHLTYLNRAGRKLLGWELVEDISAKNIRNSHPGWAYKIIKKEGIPEAIQSGIWVGETALSTHNGNEIPVSQVIMSHKSDDGTLQYLSTIIRDISEIKRVADEHRQLEMRLRQSQKMEAIGTLAGGIAHDFNNILAAVIGYTELTQTELPADSSLKKNLDKVLQASERARDLIQQILTFSRRGEQEVKPIGIGTIVKEVLKLLRASLPATIVIEQNIQSHASVMADPTQIHQTIMNLCANAAQAMQKKGGVLTINLEDTVLNSDFSKKHIGLIPGRYVQLTISDTGHGIDGRTMEFIFDPFFTTKVKGEGTGMGLAVVHGIVTQLGGIIDVVSEPDKGATFTIYLPAIDYEDLPKERKNFSLPTGNEAILFVDDEVSLAQMTQEQLATLGYSVVTCTDSRKALALFSQSPHNFDLVITDMTMPSMTGDMMALEIRKIRPDIPIIICTGYSNQINQDKAQQMGFNAFLEKPVLLKDLAQVVRQAIDDKI
jgi:PAS domain S-box-containing protein